MSEGPRAKTTPFRDSEKDPPHNLEAERSVLGSIVLDNPVLTIAREIVGPGDFYLHQNRLIFRSMLALAEARLPIDAVALMESLGRGDKLEDAGGVAYLSQLADGLPHPRPVTVEHYARVVREKSVLRDLASSAATIREQALSGHDDATTVASTARAMFAGIRDSNAENDLFDTWDEFQNAKPLRSLIENVFQADVCNVIGGLSGDGKTLILFAITKALLTGKPLFGYFKVLEMVESVIYLIPECARAPFLHRAKLFGLEEFLQNGRLKVRTLSKGLRIQLNDPRLLNVVKGAVVHVDTAIRFSTGEENDAGAISAGLASDIFGLIAAGAEGVGAAHHSAKSFEKENRISLEGVLRGSSDIGAFIGAGFGIRQIDEAQNIIHLEDIKPRDSEPFPPFQIIGRPYINQAGDFRMHREPNDCGKLADYLDVPGGSKGGAPVLVREAHNSNLELLREWITQDPKQTSEQLSTRFKNAGVKVQPVTVRKYRKELGL